MFEQITLLNFGKPVAKRKRKHAGPYCWRPTPAGSGRGFYLQHDTRELRCADHGSSFRLRLEHANDICDARRRPTAYRAGDDAFGEFTPIVARLPHGRGFLAGWTMGPGMCASVDGCVFLDAESAANTAHDEASRAAEAETEYRDIENEEEDE